LYFLLSSSESAVHLTANLVAVWTIIKCVYIIKMVKIEAKNYK